MEQPSFYEIRLEGHLPEHWSDWFDGLKIWNEPGGETVLSGSFIDQSALFGALTRIHSLNLTLISVIRSASTASS